MSTSTIFVNQRSSTARLGVSHDGAASWVKTFNSGTDYWVNGSWPDAGDIDVRNGQIVTVSTTGSAPGAVKSSDRGITWEAVYGPPAEYVNDVVHSGTRWLISINSWPSDGLFMWSDDATTWEYSTLPPEVAPGDHSPGPMAWTGQNFVSSFYGYGRNEPVQMLVSPDGKTFTTVIVPGTQPAAGKDSAVVNLAMRGRNGPLAAWYSLDPQGGPYANRYYTESFDHGLTWSAGELISLTNPVATGVMNFTGYYWCGDRWVSSEWNAPSLATSADGIVWTNTHPLPGGMPYVDGITVDADYAIYVSQGDWLIGGTTPNVAKLHSDFSTWELFSLPAEMLRVYSVQITAFPNPTRVRTLPYVTAGLRKPPSQRNPEFMAARQSRALQTMTPGSLGGRVTNASLTPVVGNSLTPSGGSQIADMIFSHPGNLVDGIWSPPYRVTVDSAKLTSVHATLGIVGTSATIADVSKNGTTFATVTIPAGTSSVDVPISEDVVVDDLVRAMITTPGAEAESLTIQVLTT